MQLITRELNEFSPIDGDVPDADLAAARTVSYALSWNAYLMNESIVTKVGSKLSSSQQ
jgi:hypothetical protein